MLGEGPTELLGLLGGEIRALDPGDHSGHQLLGVGRLELEPPLVDAGLEGRDRVGLKPVPLLVVEHEQDVRLRLAGRDARHVVGAPVDAGLPRPVVRLALVVEVELVLGRVDREVLNEPPVELDVPGRLADQADQGSAGVDGERDAESGALLAGQLHLCAPGVGLGRTAVARAVPDTQVLGPKSGGQLAATALAGAVLRVTIDPLVLLGRSADLLGLASGHEASYLAWSSSGAQRWPQCHQAHHGHR